MATTLQEVTKEYGEVKNTLGKVSTTIEGFVADTDKRQEEFQARLHYLEQYVASRIPEGGVTYAPEKLSDASPLAAYDTSGKPLTVVVSGEKSPRSMPVDGAVWSLGDYARASMGMPTRPGAAVTTGPALVPEYVGGDIIDLMRKKTVLVEAGTPTIIIPGPTNLAKITKDPTVFEHTEGVEDIEESAPVFAPILLDPSALVAAIPLTHEVISDSQNLDAALNVALAAAFAGKLDALGLQLLLNTDEVPELPIDASSWYSLLQNAAVAMQDNNAELPRAVITDPAAFINRNIELGNGAWLGRPPVLEKCIDLYSQRMPPGMTLCGDFTRGCCLAIRQQLQVEIVRFAKHKSYTHLLIAHLRAGFYTLQGNALIRGYEEVSSEQSSI